MNTLNRPPFKQVMIFLIVVLSVGTASLLRSSISTFIGPGVYFILYLLAVIIPANFYGFWAGLFAALCSAVVVMQVFMKEINMQNLVRVSVFLLVAVVCSLICGLALRNRTRVEKLLFEAQASADNERQLREEVEFARVLAERASQAKSLFLTQMSHEIRSPLNVILGFTQVLREDQISPEERNRLLDRIRVNGDHLLHIIEDILDLSKFESGKVSIEQALFSPVAVAEEVLAVFEPIAAAKGVRLGLNVDPKVPKEMASDSARLRQILSNLLSNAVKFIDSGWIELRIALEGETHLRFELEDTGLGLSEDQIPKLFQPFEQADSSVNRKFGGAGLGLVLARHMAEALGGKLDLGWSKSGKGSCFVFTIGIGRLEVAPLKGDLPQSPMQSIDLDQLQVLLAEDSPDGAAIVTRFLKRAKADVVLAVNGFEVLDRAQETAFDIVLMDIQMPGMDGLEATRRLRQAGFAKPIVALTAHALPEERARSMAAGCDAHLNKPVDKGILLSTIQNFTRRP